MKNKPPRVLLALGWYDHRLHRGVERFAREHGWQLYGDFAREKIIPWGWVGDGILTWLGADDDLAGFVLRARKPTVDFSFRRPQLKFHRVLEDHAATAGLVVSHLLATGIRRFQFYMDAHNWVQIERGRGFQAALASVGHEMECLNWPQSPAFCANQNTWQAKRKWLAGEIKRTTKPVGIFAATDGLALEAFEVCEAMGISVPEEVAIVGAGNSLLAVEAMRTPISSVDTNLEAVGYCGAQQLDRIMRRQPAVAPLIRIPPSRLIIRKSSDVCAVPDPGIARSMRFLLAHGLESIRVNDLARVASMSPRKFHQVFRRCLGRTPGAEIRRLRVEKARQLLKGSDKTIETISEECGYQSGSAFGTVFRGLTGMSPREFRFRPGGTHAEGERPQQLAMRPNIF